MVQQVGFQNKMYLNPTASCTDPKTGKPEPKKIIGTIIDRIYSIIQTVWGQEICKPNTHISQELYEFAADLPPQIHPKFCKKLSYASDNEIAIVSFLYNRITLNPPKKQEIFTEILNGGYVLLDDEGSVYEEWLDLDNIKERPSSHASCDKQYAFYGSVVHEFLFSVREIQDPKTGKIKKYTWFQLECYPMKYGYFMRHMFSWILYKVTNKNQGPFGVSAFKESNPLFFVQSSEQTVSNRIYMTN